MHSVERQCGRACRGARSELLPFQVDYINLSILDNPAGWM